ncbi:MAG TPA: helix-turn-helix transcriptional regulator [Candidatus Kapabacteria bacterium]|nr:helix-turn-helix transcriptional regulator [Candidatus Kapabacteria bacterium]
MAFIKPPQHKESERDTRIRLAFGRVLRALRTQRGLTQEELGIKCAMDRSFISDLERGAREPGLSTIMRLSEGLDAPATDLISAVEAQTKTPRP